MASDGDDYTLPGHQYTYSMDQHWQSLHSTPEAGQVLDEDWDTGCHGFEYSSFFFVVFTLIVTAFAVYGAFLYTRRRRNGALLYGFDILYTLLFVFAFLRLTPVIWSNIQLVNPELQSGTSQTACKLMAFTSIGTINVIGFLLVALVFYAWIGTKSKVYSHADLDQALRRHLGWFVLFLFALEGAAGMAPAIYTDTGVDQPCYPTLLADQRNDDYLVYISIMSFVLPYIIPFLVISVPLVDTWRSRASIEDEIHRSAAKNIVIVATSFIACYTPATLLSMALYPLLIKGYSLNWNGVCGVENFCHFIQDSFYVVIPFVLMLNDPELGRDFPGKSTACKLLDKMRKRLQLSPCSSRHCSTTSFGTAEMGPQEEEA